jgi:hypothetical protein
MNKKHFQLGMSQGTASNRLVKDILWNLIQKTNQDICCNCKKQMSRKSFSIEHLTPWLDSDCPKELFFDLNNIGFSHLSCNISKARKPHKDSREERRRKKTIRARNNYSKEKRKIKYLLTGH